MRDYVTCKISKVLTLGEIFLIELFRALGNVVVETQGGGVAIIVHLQTDGMNLDFNTLICFVELDAEVFFLVVF